MVSMSEDQSKLPVEPKKIEAQPSAPSDIPVSEEVFIERMEFQHWLVAGSRTGAGKTSLAIALIMWLKKHVKAFKDFRIVSAIPIYAEGSDGYAEGYDTSKPNDYPHGNYHGTKLHPDYIPLEDFREALYKQDCFLFLDDVGLIARARDWTTSTSKFFTKVAKNARHNRMFVIYTAQRTNELDIDLRFNINRVFIPKFRENLNPYDKTHAQRLEEARHLPIDWDEYVPKSAMERFVLPWEATGKDKQANLAINIQDPIATSFGPRPRWDQVQTFFDTSVEPSYSRDQSMTEKFRKMWGESLWGHLVESAQSLIKREFLNQNKYDIPLPKLEWDVDYWAGTSGIPLSEQDKLILMHDFLIKLDDNKKILEKAKCPKCGWMWDIKPRWANAESRRCPRVFPDGHRCDHHWVVTKQELKNSPMSAEDMSRAKALAELDRRARMNGESKPDVEADEDISPPEHEDDE